MGSQLKTRSSELGQESLLANDAERIRRNRTTLLNICSNNSCISFSFNYDRLLSYFIAHTGIGGTLLTACFSQVLENS